MLTISEALAIAHSHHEANRLNEAEEMYRQILAVEPNHASTCSLSSISSPCS